MARISAHSFTTNIICKYQMLFNFILRATATVITTLMTVAVFAIPAITKWQKIPLADGSVVTATIVGDEHGHWYVDENGNALTQNDDGTFRYIDAQHFNEIKERRQLRLSQSNDRRARRLAKSAGTAKGKNNAFGRRDAYSGSKKGIVILVNYSDRVFDKENDKDAYYDHFNKSDYVDDKHFGSVHDYFHDQSYGKFDLTFDIVGPITLSKSYSYYGTNDSAGDDLHPCEMVIEAVTLADEAGVDFSKYDWDGDGEVDQVLIIYAGTGENRSYIANDVWPHEWNLSAGRSYNDGTGAQFIDGVMIDTYCVTCELAAKGVMEGIGTACHEFSHCLGLPDTYDTSNSGGNGMGNWSVMCSGNYNGPNNFSTCPAGYTAFERWLVGWIEPVELSSKAYISDMQALDVAPEAYVIYNDGNRDEFFTLENRQPVKWDRYIYYYQNSHGLLITHIDYDPTIWYYNTVNDKPSHQRMIYVPANNRFGYSYEGHTFPGTSGNTSFTASSSPAATLYNKNIDGTKVLDKPITNISESDGRISFFFMYDNEAPKLLPPADITDDSFTAAWQPVLLANSYTLWLSPGKKTGTELLSEDFEKFTAGENTDLSIKLDSYTSTLGWYGQKVFSSSGTVKLGSSSAYGYIGTSPVKAESGVFTVYFEAKRYKEDNASMVIWLSRPSSPTLLLKDDGTHYVYDITMTEEMTPYALTFEYDGKCSVRFDPDRRAYLDNIHIYEGRMSVEDISRLTESAAAKSSTSDDGNIIITDIIDTQYTVTGLTQEEYIYRVKAITSFGETPWSAPRSVTLNTTAVNTPQADMYDSRTPIYNTCGQRIGTDLSGLPAGIYIIGNKKYLKR